MSRRREEIHLMENILGDPTKSGIICTFTGPASRSRILERVTCPACLEKALELTTKTYFAVRERHLEVQTLLKK